MIKHKIYQASSKVFTKFQIARQKKIASGKKITRLEQKFIKVIVSLFFNLEKKYSIRTLLQLESYKERHKVKSTLERQKLKQRYKFVFYDLVDGNYFEQCELGESKLTFEVIEFGSKITRVLNLDFPNEVDFPRFRCSNSVLQLKQVEMSVDSSVFTQGNRAIWPFSQSNTSHLLNSHGAGSDVLAIFNKEIALKRSKTIDSNIDGIPFLLFGARSFEWGHWTHDFLMRVVRAQPPPGSTIFVDSRLGDRHLWWIERIIPDCQIVGVELGTTVFFPHVNILQPRTFCPPTWRSELGKPKSFFNVLPEDIRDLAKLFRLSNSPTSSTSSRVFLRRVAGYRRIVNPFQFEQLLNDLEFDSLIAESLDTTDTQKKLADADWIIGVEGSAFINIVFCQKSCKVILITTHEDAQLNRIEQLQALGHEVFLLIGKNIERRGAPPGHSDIQLSDESLKTLRRLIVERS